MLKHIIKLSIVISLFALLFGCASAPRTQDGPPKVAVDVSNIPNAVPKILPKSKYGNPPSYVVNGRRYHVLKSSIGYNRRGIASWYGTKFQGRLTSSREPYNMFAMTGASKTLPIPSYVKVTNLNNRRWVIVKINDRGPFVPNRIIDLSYAAAKKLRYESRGTAIVQVTGINPRTWNAQTPQLAVLPPAGQPKLYLQTGAFSNPANANRLRAKITASIPNVKVYITRGEVNHKPIYRVRLGPLIGVGQSDKLQQQLATKGFGQAITVIG